MFNYELLDRTSVLSDYLSGGVRFRETKRVGLCIVRTGIGTKWMLRILIVDKRQKVEEIILYLSLTSILTF